MTRKKSDEDFSSFSIRIPKELREKIESEARETGRSANNLINLILKNHFNKDTKQ
ncbi:MAG: Arc family DNA-binding protein [Thiotrichaceae bacterium]